MENNISYKDSSPVLGFGSDERAEAICAAVPSLCYSNIKLIREYYAKLGKRPTYGELRVLAAILDKRRRQTDGALISALGCDSLALIETYNDLEKKAEAVYGKSRHGYTLDEYARVLGEYMRMIGRYDSRAFASAVSRKEDKNSLTVYSGDAPVVTLGGAKEKALEQRQRIDEKYAVILLDGGNYEVAYRALFTDRRARALCRGRAKIGCFGIIGTLSEHCEGARADISRLSTELSVAELLTDAYIGKHLIFTEHRHAPVLCKLAEACGLSATHLASTCEGGTLRTPYMNIPLSLVRALTDSRRVRPAYVAQSAPSAEYTPEGLYAKKNGVSYDLSDNALIKSGERLICACRITPAENSFGAAIGALTDSVLRLVAAGVDRRAICSSAVFELPAEDTDAESLGEGLALILGAYRAGVELAFSEGLTAVDYKDGRSLTSALYASAPRTPVSSRLSCEGSRLCFLPLSVGSDGLYEFASLRRICDEFIDLCRKGKILSSRAVTGRLTDALTEMSGELYAELSENGKTIADIPCRGILFETMECKRTDIIGEVRAPKTVAGEEA